MTSLHLAYVLFPFLNFKGDGDAPLRREVGEPFFLTHSLVIPVPCLQTFISVGGYYGLFHKNLGSRLQTDMWEKKSPKSWSVFLFCGSIDTLQLWQTWYRDTTSISHQQRSVSAHPEVSSGGAERCPLLSLPCNTFAFQIVGLLPQLMFVVFVKQNHSLSAIFFFLL